MRKKEKVEAGSVEEKERKKGNTLLTLKMKRKETVLTVLEVAI